MFAGRLLSGAVIFGAMGLLISTGCGIITLPIEAPKIALVNSKLIRFSVDVVDDAGNPLDGVTVSGTRHALATNVLIPETDEEKIDNPKVVNGVFSYACFGNYAVVVRYTKPGYSGWIAAYAPEDNVYIEGPGAILMAAPPMINAQLNERVNVHKNPHTRVVLKKVNP